MKTTFSILALILAATGLYAQGTAFTYQGRLNSGGVPANGTYDFVFTIFASDSGLTDSFANQTNSATSVSNGLFTVTLNLGDPNIFNGADRWLQIEVRTNGSGGYSKLSPRQKITPTPYAITAGNLVNGGLLSGNGGGLTNVNAVTVGGLSASNFWKTGGNAGTTPGVNFLGTADNQALELQVNGTRALRIEPHGGAAPSLVGGYLQNGAGGYHGATVAGGGTSGSPNYAMGDYAFVGAGHGGQAADFSAVVGGAYNVSPGQLSFIGSGERNTNQANYSFIGGGSNNFLQASATRSFIGGGTLNSNLGDIAVIVGGARNLASGAGAFIGGGGNNAAADFNTVVAGGANNRALVNASTVSGGSENTASGDHSSVSGGQGNTASGGASSMGGGVNNVSSGDYATVAGGLINTSSGQYGTIGGGLGNITSGDYATVGGGWANGSFAYGATVGGGLINASRGIEATVAGGYGNTSSGFAAAVGGGLYNAATNDYATVPGGRNNLAGGQYSFAAGHQAQALHTGAFVWADSQNADFASTTNDEFSIRAKGGVRISPDTSMYFGLGPGRQILNLWSTAYGIGVQSYTHYFRTDAGASFAWYESGSHTNAYQDPGPGGNKLMTLNSGGLSVQLTKLAVADNFEATVGAADFKLGFSGRRGSPGRALVDFTDTLCLNFGSDWAHTFIGGDNVSVCSLTVRGGCDIAEPFQMSRSEKEIPKGAVVVIDEENPGHLKMSDRACDRRVAGIISGANGVNTGVKLTQEGVFENGQNVALSGRVYVQADAGNGSIVPGDLLTTSEVPGHAMKVTDHPGAQGAILGKAMTGLKEGKGMVLVLVTLQ